MMNINKKIGIIFLVIFAILSTAFAYSVNATEDPGFGNEDNGFIYYGDISGQYFNEYGDFDLVILKGDLLAQLIIESLREHNYDDGGYIPLSDLYAFYDVLCCQQGTKLPSMSETYLIGSGGDNLGISFPYLTMNDIGKTVFKEENRKEPFPSETYTNLTLGFYKGGAINICRPKEAYILSEMVREMEGSVFYYDFQTDRNGNRIQFESSLEGASTFTVGGTEFYIVEKEFVTVLEDGSKVRVDEVLGNDGSISYQYREGSYQNNYVQYDGSLEWSESKFGSGGTYPSFEYQSTNVSSNVGSVENEVPNGTEIFITGSNLVVKEENEYYRVNVEGNNSYVQLAWWTTIAGGAGNSVADTDFSQEASAFEAYILQAAGVTSTDELEHEERTVVDENGEEKTYEYAFKIKYEPSWVEEGEFEYPTTVFEADKQSFLVGPFSIDYIEAKVQYGTRQEAEFAGITDMELFTDASEEPLTYGEQWELVYLDGERLEEDEETTEDGEEKINFPKSNEKFYIRLIDSENATKITNIKTYFRYMNASGSWQELHGTYFKATWEQQSEIFNKWVPTYDEDGNVDGWEEEYDYTQYWLELTSMEEFDSQFLGLGIKAARWYEYCTLERAVDIHDGKVVIQKEIVDNNGEEVENVDRNAFFTFRISVDGAINGGTEQVKVRAGEAVESKVYYWMGDEAPTYTVEEIDTGDYELVSIENASGTLRPDGINTVPAIAKNKIKDPKEGYINIIKLLEENELSENNTFIGKKFDFNVTVSGTFEYNGQQIEDSSIIVPVTASAATDANSANPGVAGPFYWYNEAPTYSVEEVAQEGTTLISITPQSGTIIGFESGDANKTPVTVTAKNRIDTESASIKIIKVLEGSRGLSRDYIESLSFTFEIEVDGYAKERLHLKRPTRQDENGDWVWEGKSSKYVWIEGENPNYTIKEIDVPEGTTFDEGRSQVSGTLTTDGIIGYEVVNKIINVLNTPEKGKIQIVKNVEDANLIDKAFKFAVTITGDDFKYTAPDGTVIEALKSENGRSYFVVNGDHANPKYGVGLQLTDTSAIVLDESGEYDIYNFVVITAAATGDGKGKGIWISGEFTWFGDKAPEYKVEENLLGDDIASSVEPSEGTLADTEDDTVKVTAWNRENTPKGGYIHIIKTLENAEKYTVDYVNSLVFKFKIQVDGYDETIVSLKPKLVDNKWVWEYLSDRYSWKSNEEAPNYTITEIDLPEGTTFVSAENDENSVTGTPTITGKLKESVSQEVLITTDNSFINKLPDASDGKLIVEKKVTHESLNGKEFKFKVILKGSFEFNGEAYENEEKEIYDESNPLIVKGGEKYEIGPIKWYGEDAPEYTVVELESEIAENVTVINGSGKLTNGSEVMVATFVNEPKLVGGYFKVNKVLNGDGLADEKYTFQIRILRDGKEIQKPYTITIAAGETYKSEMYKWYSTETNPTVEVTEVTENLPDGVRLVGEKTQTQQLQTSENSAITFTFTNEYDSNSGRFKIKKVILDEKLLDPAIAASQEFKLKVRVQGNYKISTEEQEGFYKDATFEITLKGGETYTSPEIVWWGENAPTVTVEEYDIPKGWQNVGISSNGSPIDSNGELEIVVTNKLPIYSIIELTTKLAGTVWEDEAQEDGKNTAESVPNGFIDASEKPVKNVEVYIYKVVRDSSGNEVERTEATVYKDVNNAPVSLPIMTSGDGSWTAPRVKIPTVSEDQSSSGYTAGYDIEFIYDGQTYEPTKFLASSNGDAASFVNATTAGKDAFQRDSMALDYDRDVVNNRIQTVEGGMPIDGNGNTTGKAVGNGTTNSLFYKSNAVLNDNNDNKKVVSELVTKNDNGTVKELFKTKARTSIGGLLFPFYKDTQNWNGFHLADFDTSITELGLEQKYWYEAVYNYCLHINLGLVKRPDADVGLAKDLHSANVFVKGNEEFVEYETFRFNSLADLSGDYYTRQVENQETVPYTLGLFSTDYYYRAEMYQDDSRLYDKVANLSKDINSELSEMEVELKYKITVYNESGSYIQVIKGINDYFDSSFGTPTKVELNSSEISGYSVTEKGIIGSDGVTYNKLEMNDLNLELVSGEIAEIYVTFRVQKDTINAVHDTIILGQKSNVAEISSYSTLNLDGSNAGKVDKDSAPDNLNIRSFNDYSWYEDDTDAAPVLYLELKEENRSINGQAWEDRPEENTTVGNGIKDNDEALIGGLTTQLVEKVSIDGIDYDFVWPTSESLNCLGGRSLKDLTGFDSTIETVRTIDDSESENVVEIGSYEFVGVPTGKYVVRFLYGNDKTKLEDTLNITEDPQALKADGTAFSGNDDILTANYDEDKVGMTTAVYNGQDYKTTIYQAGFTVEGYITNREHDLANAGLNNARVSDARDSEARRLEVIANSETIMNENANVLITANDKKADHSKLYEEYNMFADTAVLKLDLETQNDEVTVINNIDCGLVERPETAIVLDKEISSIKMTTNDNKLIFNAAYDISYGLTNNPTDKVVIAEIDGQYLVANVKLKDSSVGIEVLQAIDKNENKLAASREENNCIQNFRFINIDSEMFQGTTIEVDYLITALNVSETDYTSTTVENIIDTAIANQTTEKLELIKLAREIKENNAKSDSALQIGKYLGTNYYTGNVGEDTIVTTRVRQVVDYVDNDLVFTPAMNATENHVWKTTNVTELAGNGYDQERLLDRKVLSEYELLDKHGVAYITGFKTNVILSVDTARNSELVGNAGFEAKLFPYEQKPEDYKSQIALTVSKTVSAEDKDLSFDNIAEIVKFQNTVGRRDALAVTGNANPKLGEFSSASKERDSSATELITFTPPTGIETKVSMITQVLIVIAIASVIVVGGIIVIKKKVLK